MRKIQIQRVKAEHIPFTDWEIDPMACVSEISFLLLVRYNYSEKLGTKVAVEGSLCDLERSAVLSIYGYARRLNPKK